MGVAAQNTPMTLTPDEVTRVRSLHDRLDIKEVEDIYLPLTRLLSLYVAATQRLFRAQQNFWAPKTARCLTSLALPGQLPSGNPPPRVCCRRCWRAGPTFRRSIWSRPTASSTERHSGARRLMEKKGFPESYDLPALLRFLSDVKAGRRPTRAPIYSHLVYDVIPNQWVEIDRPEIPLSSRGSTCCRRGFLREAVR